MDTALVLQVMDSASVNDESSECFRINLVFAALLPNVGDAVSIAA
jgi:hypothetical protein